MKVHFKVARTHAMARLDDNSFDNFATIDFTVGPSDIGENAVTGIVNEIAACTEPSIMMGLATQASPMRASSSSLAMPVLRTSSSAERRSVGSLTECRVRRCKPLAMTSSTNWSL